MRTTTRWVKKPGSFDTVHQSLEYRVYPNSNNRFGFPFLHDNTFHEPARLTHYGSKDFDATAHFFLDDYRFEGLWTYPQRGLRAVKRYEAVCGPDFSCLVGWPYAVNLWNVYRSRWLTAYWQHNGVRVFPVVTWADADSFEFAFDGLPQKSVVALSTPTSASDATADLFLNGWEACLFALRPHTVLCYGERLVDTMQDSVRKLGMTTRLLVFPRRIRLTKNR